jgi:hypothetical protein
MLAGVDTGTTGYALFRINFDHISSVSLNGNIGATTGTGTDTTIATYTVIISFY